MTSLAEYLNDGANYQAKSVLAFVQRFSDVEQSWNHEYKKYDALITVARWENLREQGYVLSMRTKNNDKQLNIAFFEHRNIDNICAVKWEQITWNSPNIDNAVFGDIYRDKYDTSFDVGYGEVKKMADWIVNQFNDFWVQNI